MNLFNTFQAMAFYTAVPLAIQWLAQNGSLTWAILLGIGEFIGFIIISFTIHKD